MYLLAAAAMFVCASCATTWVASNKAPDYTGQPKKIFFRVEVAQADPLFGAAFIQALEQEIASSLQARQVQFSYTPFDPVSLETAADIEKRIADFAPDVVLTITKTVPYNTEDMQINQLDVKLMAVGQDKILWRGSVNRQGVWVGRKGGTACARSIVSRLQKDGVLAK